MAEVNWFEWVLKWYERLANFADLMYNFLFYEFDILSKTLSLWQLIGGAGLTVVIVASIVKKVVPLV